MHAHRGPTLTRTYLYCDICMYTIKYIFNKIHFRFVTFITDIYYK